MAGGRWSWWRAGASSIAIGLLGLIVAGCLDNELVAPVLSDADEVGAPEYFPLRGEAWQTRAPDEVGMDPDLLAAAVAFAQANEADIYRADAYLSSLNSRLHQVAWVSDLEPWVGKNVEEMGIAMSKSDP